jgi:hypothetical protein
MGSCVDDDEDDPKGGNGYNAQVGGRDCTNVNQKGKTGKAMMGEEDKRRG